MLRCFSILFFIVFFWSCGPGEEELNNQVVNVIQNLQKTLGNNLRMYERERRAQKEQMELVFLNDPVKVAPYKRKVDSIFSKTNKILDYINKFEEDGQEIPLDQFNEELKKYYNFILESIPPRDRDYIKGDSLFIESMDALSVLQIQNKITFFSIDASWTLLKCIDVCSYRFDTICARILPESNTVKVGSEYKADIFLSAFSATSNPVILVGEYDSAFNLIGKYDSVPVRKGVGLYTAIPKKAGKFELKGIVKAKDPADPTHYYSFPFSAKYEVVK